MGEHQQSTFLCMKCATRTGGAASEAGRARGAGRQAVRAALPRAADQRAAGLPEPAGGRDCGAAAEPGSCAAERGCGSEALESTDCGRAVGGEPEAASRRQPAPGTHPNLQVGHCTSLGRTLGRDPPSSYENDPLQCTRNTTCAGREIAPEDLHAATNGFAPSRKLKSDGAGDLFSGELQGARVTVWVPNRRYTVPWAALKAATDRLAGVKSLNVAPISAVCRDGSLVLDHMPVSQPLQPGATGAVSVAKRKMQARVPAACRCISFSE